MEKIELSPADLAKKYDAVYQEYDISPEIRETSLVIFTLNNIKLFKEFVELMEKTALDFTFFFRPDGIYIQKAAKSMAHTIDAKLNFQVYMINTHTDYFKDHDEYSFVISCDQLKKTLGSIKAKSKVFLYLSKEYKLILRVVMSSGIVSQTDFVCKKITDKIISYNYTTSFDTQLTNSDFINVFSSMSAIGVAGKTKEKITCIADLEHDPNYSSIIFETCDASSLDATSHKIELMNNDTTIKITHDADLMDGWTTIDEEDSLVKTWVAFYQPKTLGLFSKLANSCINVNVGITDTKILLITMIVEDFGIIRSQVAPLKAES